MAVQGRHQRLGHLEAHLAAHATTGEREHDRGPRRFTDLARGLNDITPTRLTSRLRQLEGAGVLTRESPEGGREVWYQLTDAGRDLAPVVDALTLWGIEHALEPPVADEPAHAEPVMLGTKVWLNRYAPSPAEGRTWVWRFPGEDLYTLRSTDGTWKLSRGGDESQAVTVVATRQDWARFLTSPRGRRQLPTTAISLEGSRAELKRFAKAFGAKLAAT